MSNTKHEATNTKLDACCITQLQFKCRHQTDGQTDRQNCYINITRRVC